MAGQIIIAQKKITLNYTQLLANTSYEFTHLPDLSTVHAREVVMEARVSQRQIGSTATATLALRGFYPDAEDGGDIMGPDLLSINLVTLPASIPGVSTATQVNNIPSRVRIVTRFGQPAVAVNILITMSIILIVRE